MVSLMADEMHSPAKSNDLQTITYEILIANEFHLHRTLKTLPATSPQDRFHNLRYNSGLKSNCLHKGDLP